MIFWRQMLLHVVYELVHSILLPLASHSRPRRKLAKALKISNRDRKTSAPRFDYLEAALGDVQGSARARSTSPTTGMLALYP